MRESRDADGWSWCGEGWTDFVYLVCSAKGVLLGGGGRRKEYVDFLTQDSYC